MVQRVRQHLPILLLALLLGLPILGLAETNPPGKPTDRLKAALDINDEAAKQLFAILARSQDPELKTEKVRLPVLHGKYTGSFKKIEQDLITWLGKHGNLSALAPLVKTVGCCDTVVDPSKSLLKPLIENIQAAEEWKPGSKDRLTPVQVDQYLRYRHARGLPETEVLPEREKPASTEEAIAALHTELDTLQNAIRMPLEGEKEFPYIRHLQFLEAKGIPTALSADNRGLIYEEVAGKPKFQPLDLIGRASRYYAVLKKWKDQLAQLGMNIDIAGLAEGLARNDLDGKDLKTYLDAFKNAFTLGISGEDAHAFAAGLVGLPEAARNLEGHMKQLEGLVTAATDPSQFTDFWNALGRNRIGGIDPAKFEAWKNARFKPEPTPAVEPVVEEKPTADEQPHEQPVVAAPTPEPKLEKAPVAASSVPSYKSGHDTQKTVASVVIGAAVASAFFLKVLHNKKKAHVFSCEYGQRVLAANEPASSGTDRNREWSDAYTQEFGEPLAPGYTRQKAEPAAAVAPPPEPPKAKVIAPLAPAASAPGVTRPTPPMAKVIRLLPAVTPASVVTPVTTVRTNPKPPTKPTTRRRQQVVPERSRSEIDGYGWDPDMRAYYPEDGENP